MCALPGPTLKACTVRPRRLRSPRTMRPGYHRRARCEDNQESPGYRWYNLASNNETKAPGLTSAPPSIPQRALSFQRRWTCHPARSRLMAVLAAWLLKAVSYLLCQDAKQQPPSCRCSIYEPSGYQSLGSGWHCCQLRSDGLSVARATGGDRPVVVVQPWQQWQPVDGLADRHPERRTLKQHARRSVAREVALWQASVVACESSQESSLQLHDKGG